MPVTAPPAVIAPSATSAQAGWFGAQTASTSPAPNPRAASPAATASIRAPSVAYESASPLATSTRAARSPPCRTSRGSDGPSGSIGS